jgi:putative exosortase-associated protein (TIGR04073 family)
MKKRILLFSLLVLLTGAQELFAKEEASSAFDKLSRGVVNTVTCWAEIPEGIIKVSKEEEPVKGCVLGTIGGACAMALRAATGIFDTLTFFVPPYDKPLMEPEYALQGSDSG